MKYKRYTEVEAEQELNKIHHLQRKYHIPQSKIDQLMLLVERGSLTGGTPHDPTLVEYLSITEAYGMNDTDAKILMTALILLSAMHTRVSLYSDRTTSEELCGLCTDLDIDFWMELPGSFSLEHAAFTVYEDNSLVKTQYVDNPDNRFKMFGFDGYTDDPISRRLLHAISDGFYNYGEIYINRKTGNVFIHHADERKEDNIDVKLSDFEEHRMCSKYYKREIMQYMQKLEDDMDTFMLDDTLVDTVSSDWLMFRRIVMLQNAIKRYQKAQTVVKRVRTEVGAKKKVHEAHIDDDRLLVVKNTAGTRSTYTSLSDFAVRTVKTRQPYKGGHHASPVRHVVSGHDRHYKSGRVVHIDPFIRGGKDTDDLHVSLHAIDLK